MPKFKTISMGDLSKRAERIATDIDASGARYRIKRTGRKTLILIDESELRILERSIDFMVENPHWQDEFVRLAKIGKRMLALGLDDGPHISLDDYMQRRGLDAEDRPSPDRRKAAAGTTRLRARKVGSRATRPRSRAS